MKRQTVLQVPGGGEPADGGLAWVSAEAALRGEIARLGEWLDAQGLDLRDDARLDEGSRDRLYWRYGYFIGLQRALALLTNRGETVH